MATSSLALVALAGTATLALVEGAARVVMPKRARPPLSILVATIAGCGGGALFVAGLASVRVRPSAGLLALAVGCVAAMGVGLLSLAARTARDDGRPTAPPT